MQVTSFDRCDPFANTETQTVETPITREDIEDLPSLTRNAYQFVELAGNVSDAGLGTRGAGFAINGQRESSTNILLDGANNNNEFAGSVGQQIPMDAIQEITVLTGDFTAEYGHASGGAVDVVGRRGGSRLQGSAYEFNRSSSLTSNSFKDNAEGVRQPAFERNEFGYSAGGAIIPGKLFFFSDTEAILVRSEAANFACVTEAPNGARKTTTSSAQHR